MSDFLVAIDGGGTTCRAALADRSGRVVGRGRCGAANIFTGSDTVAAAIVGAARAAFADAGLADADGTMARTPAFLGLAGLNVGRRQERLAETLPFSAMRFVHDGTIALQGALGDGDGAIAIFGTGSAYVVRERGAERSAGGWGFAVGDQGSGAVLGRTLLQRTLLAHDGALAHTPLSRAVMERFSGDPEALVEFAQAAKPDAYGELAPMLFAFDARGDALARDILAQALADITAMLDAVLFEGCARLCLLGGLAGEYRTRLESRHRAILHEPLGDALSGAVQLGLRAFGDDGAISS